MALVDLASATFNDKAYGERDVAPLFVSLELNAPLPSDEYVRVVALTSPDNSDGASLSLQNGNSRAGPNRLNGCGTLVTTSSLRNNTSTSSVAINRAADNGALVAVAPQGSANSKRDSVVRHDFALHIRGARMCRLLDTMLDSMSKQARSRVRDANDCNHSSKTDRRRACSPNVLPPVIIPQATRKGCEALFFYLDMITSRVPTTLSKPLRAPLEEFVQPWELKFLLNLCMDEASSVVMSQQALGEQEGRGRKNNVNVGRKMNYHAAILRGAPDSLNLLLEVAMLSDFLLVEPLRQLTCAFMASLALSVSSEEELLQLCGLQRAMTEEELDPLYAQFPFLRPDRATV